jgi:hypothetical protein
MLFSSWLRNWKRSVERRTALNQIRRPRPLMVGKLNLEWLEDRLAPATLTVNTTADDPTVINTSALTLRDAIALVNNAGDPTKLGLSTMPAAWTAQLNNTNPFGTNDTINFDIPTSDPLDPTGYHAPAHSVSITSVSLSANVATLTTSDPVPFTVGQTVTVAGLSNSNSFFDGDYQITAVTANSFSYALVHADLASTAESGTASDASWFTIAPSSTLPITNPVVIDGYSQPGASPNTHAMGGPDPSDNAVRLIVLDGSQFPTNNYDPLLSITGANSTIRGLVIQNSPNDAIGLTGSGASGNVIEGNNIGIGIVIEDSSNNTIGGTDPSARNIINSSDIGILVFSNSDSTAPSGNLIQGNYIGTTPDGMAPGGASGGRRYAGVELSTACYNNTIGGTNPSARNVISGWFNQVSMDYGGGGDLPHKRGVNYLEGNYIGTNAGGSAALVPSGQNYGVYLPNGVISNNLISGCHAAIEGGDGERVQGNRIGTDATGTQPIPNSFGVWINGANGVLIGGITPGTGNIVAFNHGPAVEFASGGGVSDAIEGNSIYGNGGPAIDNLGQYGDNLEPFIDTDYPGGPFIGSRNASVSVQSLTQTGSTLTYSFTLNGQPYAYYWVDLQVTSPDGTYWGTYLWGGFQTDASGHASFTNVSFPAPSGFPKTQGSLPAYAQIDYGTPPTDNSTITGLTLTQTGSTLTYNGTLTGQSNTRYTVYLNATSPDGTYWGSYYTYLTTDDNGNGTGQATFNLSYPAPNGFPTTQGSLRAYAQSSPPHSQGNYEQNYPVLSSASSSATDTLISGTLNGQANTTFRIEFFSNSAADPSGFGQGQTYLGSRTVYTDGSGNVSFTADLAVGNLASQWISATATDPNGNTSEFSLDVQASSAPNQTFTQNLPSSLPQSSVGPNAMTIQADPTTINDVVSGLSTNNLGASVVPVSVYLNLAPGTYQSQTIQIPQGMTLYINGKQGTTIDPVSPALTIVSGTVIVSNVTLISTGDAPTILVRGGNLTLLNDDIIQASTTSTDPAIAVTGGTLNLGTATTLGNNTLSVNSSGDLVSNTTGNAISAVGDTFVVGGIVETAPNLSFTTLTSSAAASILNQAVTLTAIVQANGSSIAPTGSVDFFDSTTNTDLGNIPLSGGVATLPPTILTPGTHVIVAKYSGDTNFLPSANTFTESVHYNFSGFLPPVKNALNFAVNRTIPIKFTLSDYNSNAITSLSAVTSLQIQALDANGNPVGAPFNPTAAGSTGLNNSGGQYIFNWQTKGLAAGSYQIVLMLADGTTHTKTIQLTTSGSSAGLVSDGSGGTATAGALLGGEVDLYVDNSNGDLTSDELNRIQDAVNSVDATIAPYGVVINEVSDPTQANVTLNMNTTSALGGVAQGVLGCTSDADQVTMIQGWNWYAGADPTQVGSGQYDFETAVMHELGHVLGLGHSSNPTSVMYAMLATGTANRALVTADLNVPDDDSGPCALHAAPVTALSSTSNGTAMTPASSTSFPSSGSTNSGSPMSAADQLFANLSRILSAAQNAYQSELSSVVAMWRSDDALALQRLDVLLSMEAGAMGVTKDTLLHDFLFASSSSSSDV